MTYWEGGATVGEIASALGLSREHVQREIVGAYRREYPAALGWGRDRSSVFTEGASGLKYAPSSTKALLDVLRGARAAAESTGAAYPFRLPVETLPEPISEGDTKAEIFQTLCSALARRVAVIIDYTSKKTAFQASFSPHTIVDIGLRPHFRGFAEYADGTGMFIDIVPARISSTSGTSGDYVDSTNDKMWHFRQDMTFFLSKQLALTERTALIEENGGRESITFRHIRSAICPYVERMMYFRGFNILRIRT